MEAESKASLPVTLNIESVKRKKNSQDNIQYLVTIKDKKNGKWINLDQIKDQEDLKIITEFEESLAKNKARAAAFKKPSEILGITFENDQAMYIVKYKNESKPELVTSKFAKTNFPKDLLKFLEQNITFMPSQSTNSPPKKITFKV